MKLTHLVIDGLAAWRISRLVVVEDSPVSMRIREEAEHRLPEAWAPVVTCQHCTGMWAALALAGLRGIGLGWLAYPLAVAGVSSLGTHVLETLVPPEIEEQGPVVPRVPFADIAAARTGDVDASGRAARPLVGRALSGQEAATGRTKVDYEGNPLPSGDRALHEDEQRYGRLAR